MTEKAAPEPVAWAQLGTLNSKSYLRMNYDRIPYPPPPDVVRNLNLKPLYTHPNERVAMLEGLLREAPEYIDCRIIAVENYLERIRAALEE